jgi:hypothetical protein
MLKIHSTAGLSYYTETDRICDLPRLHQPLATDGVVQVQRATQCAGQ